MPNATAPPLQSARAAAPHVAGIPRADRRPVAPNWVGPAAVAGLLVMAVGLSGVRGADYPAHEFRAEFWRRAAGSTWNFAWYGGHSVASYGVLSPPIAAALGAFLTVALATVVATGVFASIVHDALPRRAATIAACTFAVVATADVVVGRVAFGVGLAIGTIAVAAWQRGRLGWALLAAGVTSLASPVAGAFLALCAGSAAIASVRRWSGIGIAAAAALPVVVTTVAFGSEGRFPFRGGHLAMTLGVLALAGWVVAHRAVRVACAVSCIAAVALFVVPNAMGGNFVRLPQIVAVPLVVAAAATRRRPSRRAVVWPAAVVAVAWSASPAVVAAATWSGDDSTDRAFHAPLIAEIRRRNGDGAPGRVEIPFTANHWEAAWVATEVPYARGWERQLDVVRNPELYAADLTPDTYRRWLDRNAVRWIAVPAARLDHSADAELDVVLAAERRGDDWLRRVWTHPDWVLFEVDAHRPIVGPGADLVRFDVGALVVAADHAAVVDIRITHSRTLAIWPEGCLGQTSEGTVRARLPAAGTYRIASALWDARRSQECAPP